MASEKTSKQYTDEQELGGRFRDGDEAAFNTLYLRHHKSLQAFIRKLPGMADQADKRELVQDIAAEAFTNAWASHATFKPDLASFSTWIHTIARNIYTNLINLRMKSTKIAGADWGLAFTKGEEEYAPTNTEKADRAYHALLMGSMLNDSAFSDAFWLFDEEDNPLKLSRREKRIVSEMMELTPKDKIAKKCEVSTATLDTAICRIKKKFSGVKK